MDAISGQPSLEEAFRLIEDGNKESKAMDHWKAAESYSKAQSVLHRLTETTSHQCNEGTPSSEQAMFISLYRQQSKEYLKRARKEMIAALQDESEKDRDQSTSDATAKDAMELLALHKNSVLLASLSEEDCSHRMNIFGRLFAMELEETKMMHEKEAALASRLQDLSDSLPASAKSEAERLRDFNRGLARLGLSVVSSHGDSGYDKSVLPTMSEADQVEWIIAQAKDEVEVVANDTALAEAAAAGTLSISGIQAVASQHEDGNRESDDGNVDDSLAVDEDADLTPEICQRMHDKLVDAQVSLSELVALFDVDEGNVAAIEFDQSRGRFILNETIHLLQDVASKWETC